MKYYVLEAAFASVFGQGRHLNWWTP